MRELDEKILHKKVFQPLQFIEMDKNTGYQKYYNDYFTEEQPGMDKKPTVTQGGSSQESNGFHYNKPIQKKMPLDPVLEQISGGDPSVIDKMRYISKKELAKHRALVKDKDFKRFDDIDLKNENEI